MDRDDDKIFPDFVFQGLNCPVCGKAVHEDFDPFCSKECMVKDPSNQWLEDNSITFFEEDEVPVAIDLSFSSNTYLELSDELAEISDSETSDLFRKIIDNQNG